MTDNTDPANPVINMGARVYLPHLAKFTTPDPIEGGVGNADYLYPPDPVNRVDINGQFQFTLEYDLGPSDVSPEELFDYWAAHFDALFPIAGAPTVMPAEGSNIDLNVGGLPFRVQLVDVWNTGFKFVTRRGHPVHSGWIQFNLSESDNGNLHLTITGNVWRRLSWRLSRWCCPLAFSKATVSSSS